MWRQLSAARLTLVKESFDARLSRTREHVKWGILALLAGQVPLIFGGSLPGEALAAFPCFSPEQCLREILRVSIFYSSLASFCSFMPDSFLFSSGRPPFFPHSLASAGKPEAVMLPRDRCHLLGGYLVVVPG